MSFEVEGKLHKVFPTEQKTDTFRAREFVIEIEQGNYPQFIKFQLVQDRCDVIDEYKEGDMLKVYFDLRGRQWQDKFFTNLQAWRVEAGQGANDAPPFAQDAPMPTDAPGSSGPSEEMKKEDFDDLPF